MLTRLELQNFKCFDTLKLDLKLRVNVLIGPNGSGKSSVLQVLALLKQSVGDEKLNWHASAVPTRSFRDFVRQRGEGCTFQIEGYEVVREVPAGETVSYRNRLHVQWPEGEVYPDDCVLEAQAAGWTLATPQHGENPVPKPNGRPIFSQTRQIGMPFILADTEAESAGEGLYWRPVTSVLQRQLQDHLYIVPVKRGLDRAWYDFKDSGDGAIAVSGATDEDVRTRVSEWLGQVTGVVYSAGTELDDQRNPHPVSKAFRGKTGVDLIHEGFGSNQLVHVFTILAKVERGATVCIEEPEMHLHPESQLKLGKVLVDIALKKELQLVITTHSEHILFAFLTAIAERGLSLSDFALHYFGPEPGRHRRLEVTESGAVKGGLPGFLDAEIEAFRKLVKALPLQQ